jgi:hypothetical protein
MVEGPGCRKGLDLQCFDMIYDGNGKSSALPRGMLLVTRMFACSLEANMRGIKWRPRECKIVYENAHRALEWHVCCWQLVPPQFHVLLLLQPRVRTCRVRVRVRVRVPCSLAAPA